MANHHKLTRALEVLYAIRPRSTLSQVMAFLYVASDEGIYQHVVQERLSTNSATSFRTISVWKYWEEKPNPSKGKSGTKGAGLIETHPDPENGKLRICTLTPHGRVVLEQINAKAK